MTKLTGRHMEFELFTLSFDEYLGMKGFLGKPVGERRAEFEEYLRCGGFPRALTYDDPEAKVVYVFEQEDILNYLKLCFCNIKCRS